MKYNNKEYTMKELAKIAKKQYNNDINLMIINQRLKLNWPIEKVLKTKVIHPIKINYEYKGKIYHSQKDLIRIAKEKYNNNLNAKLLSARLTRYNWSIEKALKTPINTKIGKGREIIYDYKNKKYRLNQLQQLAIKKYNNKISTYNIATRINKLGWSVKKTLKTPVLKKYKYKNKKYTLKELQKKALKKYNNKMSIATLNLRINKLGWSVKKTLKTPAIKRIEYKGKYYKINELLEIFKNRFDVDVYKTIFTNKLRQGYSLEDALEIAKIKKYKKIYKYKGKDYTINELLEIAKKDFNNDISYDLLSNRIKKYYTIEEALSTKVRKYNKHK